MHNPTENIEADPLVSIVIATYNYEVYIPYTLDCIIAQTYRNLEIIVVDDGSSDNTGLVVERYRLKDPRVKYFHQKNAGPSMARNLGIDKSSGKYVGFLDADDLISVEMIELQVRNLEQIPGLGISYCNAFYFKTGQQDELFKTLYLTQQEWIPQLKGQFYETVTALIKGNIMPINSALMHRDMFLVTGLFDTELINMEDWEFWLRTALLGVPFHYLDDKNAFAMIRVHPGSASRNVIKMNNYEIDLRLKMESRFVGNQLLTVEQIQELVLLNSKKMKIPLSLVIRKTGFLNFKRLRPLLKKSGAELFFKAYAKGLNDSRKRSS